MLVCSDCQKEFPRLKTKMLCNACYARLWRRTNPEKSVAISRRNHQKHSEANRRRCRENYQRNREERLTKQNAHYEAHREERGNYNREYARRNKAKLREYHRTYGKKWAERNRERAVGYSKKWRLRHPEKRRAYVQRYLQDNKDVLRERWRRWAKGNLIRWAGAARYRAKRRMQFAEMAVCDLTATQWDVIKATWDNMCAYCGNQPIKLTQDHVVPVSKGGSHTFANVVPACKSCNSRKKNQIWKPNLPRNFEAWEDAYRNHYGTEPPKPYPIAILGHAHEIAPPNA